MKRNTWHDWEMIETLRIADDDLRAVSDLDHACGRAVEIIGHDLGAERRRSVGDVDLVGLSLRSRAKARCVVARSSSRRRSVIAAPCAARQLPAPW